MKTKIGDIKSIEDLFEDRKCVGSLPSGVGIDIAEYTWTCRICGDTIRGADREESLMEHIEFHQLLDKLKLRDEYE